MPPTHAASAYNASVPADILYLRIIAERIRIVGPDGDIYVLLNVLKICPKMEAALLSLHYSLRLCKKNKKTILTHYGRVD